MAGSEFQSLGVIGIKVDESARSIFIQFDSKGVLSVRKPRVSSIERLGGIIDFSSIEQTP